MSTLIKKKVQVCALKIFSRPCLEGELASSGCDASHTWTAQVSPFLE